MTIYKRPGKWDSWRQRQAFNALAVDGPAFLETAEGVAFREELKTEYAGEFLALARKNEYYLLEADDIVSIALTGLLAKDGVQARYCAASTQDPFAYFHGCLYRLMAKEWGHRSWAAFDDAEYFIADPRSIVPDAELTPLHEVVALTHDVLRPLTEESLRPDLYDLLSHLAANPPQRLSYTKDDRIKAHRYCPAFTVEQVKAVMNIAWGGRPNEAATSLMGAFLIDAQFTPESSPSHQRAVNRYKHQMRAGATGRTSLLDWK